MSNGLEIISGVNDTLVINVNGIAKTYTFSPGSYSASELVQELNDKLNADNMAVSILDGNLNLAQNDGLSMNLLGGNLSRDLFFSYSEGTADEDTDNKGISIQKGITADDTLVLDMPNCTGTELGMPGLNISTAETASNAIQSIKNAITITSAYRARMGAYQNRLEHTLSNVQNYAENLTASESRIRDADIAKEMTELIKNRIIAEAGIAVLAQANALPQSILKLLM
ncbi:flagellin [Paenibacillus sp. 32O-W]|nr:flagellin [Paenibacillus sp. 32O-W]